MINKLMLSRRRFCELSAAGIAVTTMPFAPSVAAQERNFVFADAFEVINLSPWIGMSNLPISRAIYESLFETRMTLEGDLVVIDLVPRLAESWEQIDDLTTRFTLRQGVTFTNGERMNAEAVKASWDILSDVEIAAEHGGYSVLQVLQGCEIVDDFAVDISTHVPDNEALLYLPLGLLILPPQKLTNEGIESFTEHPVGTGAYMLQNWDRGNELVLERNTDYWDDQFPNTYNTLSIIVRPEATVRAQTIASGEADFAFNIGAEQASTLQHSVVGGGFQSTSIRINNSIAPTNELDLRLAINHAIDRESTCEAIFLGTAVPIAFPAFQPVTLEPYAYDPDLATRLVDEGGWAGTELELVYGEGRVPEEDQLAELYKAYLEAIGLIINLRKVEPGQYNEIGEQEFEAQPALYMETTSTGNYGEIAGSLTALYGTDGIGTFSDPEFDQRFITLATLENDERLVELQSIADDLHALAPRVWVAGIQQVHGLSERVNPSLPLNNALHIRDLVG